MHTNFIFLALALLCMSINGQYDEDRDLPQGRQNQGRTLRVEFDKQFSRGRCPQLFYQLGNECVYFSPEGKVYSWRQAERACSGRVARMLLDQPYNPEQPNMQPTKGVRQLVLNTPEKTDILRALFREYNEQNFAVSLPADYNTLARCQDGQDDKWPQYCSGAPSTNSTCFETIEQGSNSVCLREVECRRKYLRLACEFTLPGNPELTSSTFRTCAKGQRRRGFPTWGWIASIVGGLLLLLIILAVVFTIIRKSKKPTKPKEKSLPVPRQPEEQVIRVSTKREDPAAEPMLIRTGPPTTSDNEYLQPQSLPTTNTANA